MENTIKVIGVVGHPGSGKDTVADYIAKKGYNKISTGDVLREKMMQLGIPTDRAHLHEFAKEERRKYGNAYPAGEVVEIIQEDTVVVGLRNTEEVKFFKEKFGDDFFLVAVETPLQLRYERAKARQRFGDDISFERFKEEEARERAADSGSHEVDKVVALADYLVTNDQSKQILHKALTYVLSQVK